MPDRSLSPRPIDATQSSRSTVGITVLSGERCASNGTDIMVEPKPEMPKTAYATRTISVAKNRISDSDMSEKFAQKCAVLHMTPSTLPSAPRYHPHVHAALGWPRRSPEGGDDP